MKSRGPKPQVRATCLLRMGQSQTHFYEPRCRWVLRRPCQGEEVTPHPDRARW
jgi:hypothetical protein